MLAQVQMSDTLRTLCDIPHLPPLPVIAQQILEQATDKDVDIRRLSKTIEQDPGVMARIIGLSNAAYFGQPKPIYTVQDAIVRVLGLKTVSSLAIGILLSSPFDVSKCGGFDLQRYWHVALLSAAVGRSLAPLLKDESIEPDSSYLCGLLHNIGMLVLTSCFPSEMGSAIRADHEDESSHLIEIEERELGIDHHCAGAVIARKWHLPLDVSVVIENHHDKDYQGELARKVKMIGLASRIANTMIAGDELQVETDELGSLGIDSAAFEQVIERITEQNEDIASMSRILAIE
ncbi:hypothetical protein BOW53_01495 [Solemya pervernicosa gill symbiont]|uniref:HDOD domain-containing protein n=2 Tax=Gammaproteobacteria incertae sedis TaxID=118884 RepID=A0A1T2LAE2_9GAMM|nr:hypothetical protein BOW53_01495 [Solemya pervernicosa gill symbiont]